MDLNKTKSLSHGRDEYKFVQVDHVELTEKGIIPLRVDEQLLADLSGFAWEVARMAAGIQMHIRAIGISSLSIRLRVIRDDGFPPAISLSCGDRKIHPTKMLERSSAPQTITWPLIADYVTTPLRVFLPTHAEVEIIDVSVNEDANIERKTTYYCENSIRWLAHGDSITHGASATSPDFTWVEQIARKLDLCPTNLGFGGNARAQPSMASYIARLSNWDFLSIHIGANSCGENFQDYLDKFRKFVDIIRETHSTKPIVIVTPIIHKTDIDENKGQGSIEEIRRAINHVVHEKQKNDKHLYLLNGLAIMGYRDGLLYDDIHPSDHGMQIYAANLSEALKSLIEKEFPVKK